MEENQSVKEEIKTKTRRRILLAGVQAFAKYGFHGMKIAAVARDAGIANGTFYLHFKDKTELYLEIVRTAVSLLSAQLFAIHNYETNKGIIDRKEIEAILSFAENNRDLCIIMLDPRLSELAGHDDLFKPLTEIRINDLKKGIESGNISREINPVIAARAEIGMIISVIQWWTNNNTQISREEFIATLTQLRRSWAIVDDKVDDIDALLNQWDSRL